VTRGPGAACGPAARTERMNPEAAACRPALPTSRHPRRLGRPAPAQALMPPVLRNLSGLVLNDELAAWRNWAAGPHLAGVAEIWRPALPG
jgi:hypothetical protein